MEMKRGAVELELFKQKHKLHDNGLYYWSKISTYFHIHKRSWYLHLPTPICFTPRYIWHLFKMISPSLLEYHRVVSHTYVDDAIWNGGVLREGVEACLASNKASDGVQQWQGWCDDLDRELRLGILFGQKSQDLWINPWRIPTSKYGKL